MAIRGRVCAVGLIKMLPGWEKSNISELSVHLKGWLSQRPLCLGAQCESVVVVGVCASKLD